VARELGARTIATTAPRWPKRVLILREGSDYGGDFGLSFAEGFRDHGCEVELAGRSESWHQEYDLVLGYGPFTLSASMLPVAHRLLALPVERRPVFVWWLTEGTPQPWLPTWFVEVAAGLRLALDRRLVRSSAVDAMPARPSGAAFSSRGHRLRVFGELRWLQSRGILGVLAVTSASRATYLRRRGFQPITVPLGYHPVYGTDLGLPRDIDVCFLGSTDSKRRGLLLERVQRELRRYGTEVSVQTALYGDSRTRFLNRARIIVNILRVSHDSVGQRFLLAAANKTLAISEPIKDSEPFRPGHHLVVTPIERLAETVQFYLSHEEERRQIVEEAYRLVTQELTITRAIGRIIEHAREVYASRLCASHVR